MKTQSETGRRRAGRLVAAAALCAFVLATTLLAGLWGAHAQSAPFPVYFTDNVHATAVTTTVTPLEQALLNRITSATTSIDAAIYDFSRASVRAALIAAHQRGVSVRIVGDDEARVDAKSKPNFDALQAAGIPMVFDGPIPTTTTALADGVAELQNAGGAVGGASLTAPQTSLLMHDKYLIVDKRWVWTGSINLSDSDITLNHNNALDIDSAPLAALYQADFDQMFGGKFGTQKSAGITHSVTISGAPVQLYFAPQDNPIQQVIASVNAAQTSIDFAIFTFTDDALANALLAAHARGVRVRGLWDALGASNGSADDEAMCAAGLAIKIEDTRGLMHNKILVIDADTPAARVVTGSLNWTAGGNSGNNENTLLVDNAPLTQQYAAEFQKLWTTITAAPCNPEAAIGTQIRLPLIFNLAQPPTPTPVPVMPTPAPTPTPTPTLTPTLTPTSTAPAAVRMSRIVYDPVGSDLDGEFVEVVNGAPAEAILTGWTLRDEAGAVYTFPQFALPPGAAVKVWVKAGVDGAADLYWGRGSAVWNNDGDVATLQESGGALVAQCPYTQDTGEAQCP